MRYKQVTVHNHPFFPGRRQVLRSRLVMAEYLGRILLRSEHVHHMNEDTMDDRIDNLELMSVGQHRSHHMLDNHYWSGRCHSMESKKKISLNHRGMKGLHHTDETKKKMSVALKDRPSPMGFKNKRHTIEAKCKISLANRNKIFTIETRKRMSLARKDYCLSLRFPGLV